MCGVLKQSSCHVSIGSVHTFVVENAPSPYVCLLYILVQRNIASKFRCSVAPIRSETGRFEGLPVERRLYPFCHVVEDKSHVLLKCTFILYNDKWVQQLSCQWKSICMQLHRFATMDNARTNKKIFNWCIQNSSN